MRRNFLKSLFSLAGLGFLIQDRKPEKKSWNKLKNQYYEPFYIDVYDDPQHFRFRLF